MTIFGMEIPAAGRVVAVVREFSNYQRPPLGNARRNALAERFDWNFNSKIFSDSGHIVPSARNAAI